MSSTLKTTISKQILPAAQQGDKDAIEELLVHCGPDLSRFARRICNTPKDAKDAVQEALWIISQNIRSLKVVSAFFGWAFKIIIRQCPKLFNASIQ